MEKINLKDHVKQVGSRYGLTFNEICENLNTDKNPQGLTRNSLFVKLKNESVKISYLPELAKAIGCQREELILPSSGFEHKYSKGGQYLGIYKMKNPD